MEFKNGGGILEIRFLATMAATSSTTSLAREAIIAELARLGHPIKDKKASTEKLRADLAKLRAQAAGPAAPPPSAPARRADARRTGSPESAALAGVERKRGPAPASPPLPPARLAPAKRAVSPLVAGAARLGGGGGAERKRGPVPAQVMANLLEFVSAAEGRAAAATSKAFAAGEAVAKQRCCGPTGNGERCPLLLTAADGKLSSRCTEACFAAVGAQVRAGLAEVPEGQIAEEVKRFNYHVVGESYHVEVTKQKGLKIIIEFDLNVAGVWAMRRYIDNDDNALTISLQNPADGDLWGDGDGLVEVLADFLESGLIFHPHMRQTLELLAQRSPEKTPHVADPGPFEGASLEIHEPYYHDNGEVASVQWEWTCSPARIVRALPLVRHISPGFFADVLQRGAAVPSVIPRCAPAKKRSPPKPR